jgi:hypothetical protein
VVAEPSVLSRRGNLLGLSLWSGAPYGLDQGPCNETDEPEDLQFGTPWIWAEKKRDLIRGDRAYFYACDFITWNPTDNKTKLEWAAEVVGPDGREYPLEVRFYLPPDESKEMHGRTSGNEVDDRAEVCDRVEVVDRANGVVVWNATCELPPGPYTMTIKMLDDETLIEENGIPKEATHSFGMTMTTTKRILAVPPAAPAGSPIQVYACNYEPGSLVKLDLFFQAARQPYTLNERIFWRHIDTLPVAINRRDEWGAWGTLTLTSAKDDPGVAYRLKDHDRSVREDFFWLLR